MDMDRISEPDANDMPEIKFFFDIVQKGPLHYQDQVLAECFECLSLVMHLEQYSFGCHLPVYPESLFVVEIAFRDFDAMLMEQSLALWPDGPCRIHRLELNANEVSYLAIARGDQEPIHAPTGDGDLRDDV